MYPCSSALFSSFAKRAFVFLFLFSPLSGALAQTSEWTWMGGSNLPGKFGIYGTKGIADPGNIPGGRSGAIQWQDADGSFWLMGGFGNASTGTGNLNDLWMYAPGTNSWTWESGDNTINPASVYGTMGVADPANKPGGRSQSSSFGDASGNLWLMGGYNGSGSLNDLWMFTPSTAQWIWVSGDKTINKPGVYGTKTVAAPGNKPGARYASASCVDANGDFWLFGGYGFGTTTANNFLNDLWKFTPSTSQWTWISGDNSAGQAGVYGTKGTPDAANKPGARYSSVMWTDASGNIWLFGGNGFALSNVGVGGTLNDLWMFSPATGQWTWISGDNAINITGVYGTMGTASVTNKPGGRYAPVLWQNTDGTIYLFGGSGYAFNTTLGSLSDLWKLNPSTAEWTWMGGSKIVAQKGIYGTAGSPSSTNIPGARYTASGWKDAGGKLWLFGGNGIGSTTASGYLNDLWTYLPPVTTLPVLINRFTAQMQTGKVQLNWTTDQEQNSDYFIIGHSADGIKFENIGKVSAAGNSSVMVNYSFIDFAPVKGTNLYRLQQFDKDGRFFYSRIISVMMDEPESDIRLVQNPVLENLQLMLQLPVAKKMTLIVRNAAGNLILQKELAFASGTSRYSLPVAALPKGVYYLSLFAEGAIRSTKTFIKL